MSNLINLTARLRSLSAELVDAEHEEDAAKRHLALMQDNGDELSIHSAQHRYDDACANVDRIDNEIDNIENEMEELTNAHDDRDEDF